MLYVKGFCDVDTSKVTAKEAAFFALGNDVFQLTFKTKRRDTLYFPNSLLAEGRSSPSNDFERFRKI